MNTDSIDKPQIDNVTQIREVAMPIKYLEPDWYSSKFSKIFHRLTTEDKLLESVTPIFANAIGQKLGVELIKFGFRKVNGDPLERATISEVKRVVNYLNGKN